MRLRHRTSFSTIRTEGAILPPDLLERIHEGDNDVGGLKAQDYHLQPGERLNEVISRSWNRMLAAWRNFQADLKELPDKDPGTTVTRERLLLVLFQELGYGRLQTTKAIEREGKSYPVSHEWNRLPIHLVGARVKLGKRTPGVAGAARSSPHSMVQDLLNRSDEHLWAFLSNGYQLRILRDNISLVRQTYVEFDLYELFEGEAYSDFTLLWMLCHESRVEANVPEEFWLEKWSQQAQEQGARALNQLRDGVEAAIRDLGQGFLIHPANQALQNHLRSGELTGEEYYRQLLRLVYRLIFLFAAEDRNLLHPPGSDSEARERYQSYYSTVRLRRLARRRRGTRHEDLFQGLKLVMEKLGQEGGCPELGLPALGSFLWSKTAIPDLEASRISNHAFLDALRSLAFTTDGSVRRAVDYKNMGAEELGSVYEALLELQPELNTDAGTFALKVVGGSERKTTGSYYTPSSLIQQLLNTALDPVVEEALKAKDPKAALLDLKVCDPACGSGHFLIAAAHRMAKHLASLKTGDPEPSPKSTRSALREIIAHCIYGVDINPMAVELCKVNLWLEALDPGKPLSFLDHRIQYGNSLLGATPALMEKGIPDEAFKPIEGDDKKFASSLKKQNKQEREGQLSMFAEFEHEERVNYALLQKEAIGIAETDDSTVKVVREKGEKYRALLESEAFRHSKLLADAWCAAFVWHKTADMSEPITEASFRKLASNPKLISNATKKEIERLSEQFQFFHWHLAFPGVFWLPEAEDEPENELTGWSGGFDAVLGNPPWDILEVSEREFFAGRADLIAGAISARERKVLIKDLKIENRSLYNEFIDRRRFISASRYFIQNSGRYPLSSFGRINLYPLFIELDISILDKPGCVGLIVPSAISLDAYNAKFFEFLLSENLLSSFLDFENKLGIFPAVHRSYRFALLTLSTMREDESEIRFCYFCHHISEIRLLERNVYMSISDIEMFSPNTFSPPMLQNATDERLAKKIYREVGVLHNRSTGDNPWKVSIKRMLALSDKGVEFRRSTNFPDRPKSDEWSRLYSGKSIHKNNHRFSTWDNTNWRESTSDELSNPAMTINTEYYAPIEELMKRTLNKNPSKWLIGYRDVCRATDERTCIATVIPMTACDTHCRNIYTEINNPVKLAFLVANLNSFVFDYFCRQKVISIGLGAGLLEQLPVLSPDVYSQVFQPSLQAIISTWIRPYILELIYTAWDLELFVSDFGYNDPPFAWNDNRRFLLQCELDAAFFHIYGIAEDDVDYIMETFPIVKRKDEQKHGEYYTKRTILEIFDEMYQAIEIRVPYQTRLDPPPGDPSLVHSAR